MVTIRIVLQTCLIIASFCISGAQLNSNMDQQLYQVSSLNFQKKSLTIELDSISRSKDQIFELFPHKMFISKLEIDTDSTISFDEISYLLGLRKGGLIHAKSILLGLDRLKRKNVFSVVHCEFTFGKKGVAIKMRMITNWTLESIKVAGVSFGKQAISQQYRLYLGHNFSVERHTNAVTALVQDLKSQGFYDAKVESFIEYDQVRKGAKVHLVVRKGKLYVIAHVSCQLICTLEEHEKQKIRTLLQKQIIGNLVLRSYSQKMIDGKIQAIKALLSEQGFIYTDVVSEVQSNSEKKSVTLQFIITFKQSQRFVFLGNKFFSSTALLESIKHCNTAIGVLPSVVLAEEMIDLYNAHGFLRAKIETEQDSENCYFLVHENRRSTVDGVIIRGSRYVTGEYLVKHFFSLLLKKPMNRKKLQHGVKRCLDWYRSKGFWDATFLKKENIPVPHKKNAYCITCVIDEGKQRLLKSIHIEGLPELRKVTAFKKFESFVSGYPLTQEMLVEQKTILEQECKKDGYMQHVKITQELVEHPLDQNVSEYEVIWRIKVHKQLRFGKTIFSGNSSIAYTRLFPLIPYQEGQVYQKELVTAFYEKLRTTGAYKSVAIQQHFMSDVHDACDIIVALEDDDPYEIKVRAGFQQVSKNFAFKKGSSYKLGGSFIWKNPREKADNLIFDADVTRFERRVSVSYKQPLLFALPLESILKGYSNSYMQPVSVGSYKVLYEALQHGALYGIVSKNEHYDIGLSSGVEWMKIKNVAQGLIPALVFTPELVNQLVFYGFCEPTLYVNYLDNHLNPSEGHFTFGSCKMMVPSNERASSSIRLLFEHGRYTSFRSVTGVARLKFGHIFMQNFSSIMPSNRFYLGGANSLRGYQPDKCPPLGSFVDENGVTQWVAQGGKSMININAEVRFPLPVHNLQGAVFQDFGILAADAYSLLKDSKPVAATGFGLRYVTPLGPLRFDIGWKWNKQYEQDTSYAWFLTFGYAF